MRLGWRLERRSSVSTMPFEIFSILPQLGIFKYVWCTAGGNVRWGILQTALHFIWELNLCPKLDSSSDIASGYRPLKIAIQTYLEGTKLWKDDLY